MLISGMRKLMIGLLSLVAASAMAGAIVVQQTDEIVGYDGGCQVYFRPDLGFFEVCESSEPVVLGMDFDTIHFRNGFRFREGFTRERLHSMHADVNVSRDTGHGMRREMRNTEVRTQDRHKTQERHAPMP